MVKNSFRSKVLEFWQAFSQDEYIIREMINKGADPSVVLAFTESILKIAFSEICFQVEADNNNKNKYELTLSPQGDRVKLIQYHYWCMQAPNALKRYWNFRSSKSAFKTSADNSTVMFDVMLKPSDVILYPKIDNQHSKIELFIYSPKLDLLDEAKRYSIFFKFLDQHIGESYSIDYVSNIQFIDQKIEEQAIEIDALRGLINRAIMAFGWQKNRNPLESYISYSLTPKTSNDWKLREDISAGYTSGIMPIHSFQMLEDKCFKTYERNGVTFAFLFYENSNLTEDQLAKLHTTISTEVSKRSGLQNVANCIGAAVGHHFSYIDFIIYDFQLFSTAIKDIINKYKFEEVGLNFFHSEAEPILLS